MELKVLLLIKQRQWRSVLSINAHAELIDEVTCLRETSAQIQSTVDTIQMRLQVLEPWMEGQLDVLIWTLQPAARPSYSM